VSNGYYTDKIITGGSIPSIAVAANFPADYFGFTGSDGLSLGSEALDTFLQALGSSIYRSINANTILSLVVCTITGSNGTIFTFNNIDTVFKGGASINIESYQYTVIIGL
jgi:hypothetical protein